MESPLPPKKTDTVNNNQLDFSTAVRRLIEGKKLSRIVWGNQDEYIYLRQEYLSLHKAGEPADKTYDLIVREGDMIAIDWVIVG